MNEQVMYWLAAASNRPAISAPMMKIVEDGGIAGGEWMLHNYYKMAWFNGQQDKLSHTLWPLLVNELKGVLGATKQNTTLKLLADGLYHVVGCSSPEYNCYSPFGSRACSPRQDCNYEISQLRWGIATVLELMEADPELKTAACDGRGACADTPRPCSNKSRTWCPSNPADGQCDQPAPSPCPACPTAPKRCAVDFGWWKELIDGALTWYPYDDVTGFRLDVNCAFECPHRHFSHLLQMYDLETVEYKPVSQGGNASLNKIMHNGLDNWFRVTCNASNVFNEECRGFTQCGMSAMSAVTGRKDAAVGNLTGLVDTVITPNGMYGEMVYMDNPNEFSPVSESAYCGAGNVHTILLHTSPSTKLLSVFPAVPERWQDVGFHQLRAGGGLLVSANRTGGVTQFVRLLSETGGALKLRVVDEAWETASAPPSAIPSTVKVSAATGAGVSKGDWTLTLGKNESVVLYLGTKVPELTIAPLAGNASEYHWFGYTREMQPLH
jgi:hypothetical protein